MNSLTAVVAYNALFLACFNALADDFKLNFVENFYKPLYYVIAALSLEAVFNETLVKLDYINGQDSDEV